MFGFGKQAKITAIFAQLNQFRNSIGLNKAESVISRADVESILELSGDVRTTVELVRLFWESMLAERMAASATYDAIARDFVDVATRDGKNPDALLSTEIDGLVETAKLYGENVAQMFDRGEIVDNRKVRQFAAEKATTMLAAWQLYRLRLRSAYETISPCKTP